MLNLFQHLNASLTFSCTRWDPETSSGWRDVPRLPDAFLCRYNKTGGLKAPGYLCSRLPDTVELWVMSSERWVFSRQKNIRSCLNDKQCHSMSSWPYLNSKNIRCFRWAKANNLFKDLTASRYMTMDCPSPRTDAETSSAWRFVCESLEFFETKEQKTIKELTTHSSQLITQKPSERREVE